MRYIFLINMAFWTISSVSQQRLELGPLAFGEIAAANSPFLCRGSAA
jgi:hypothetical protein